MCRHIAYLGRETSLASVVLDPPHSLAVQSYAPRNQAYGRVNADGFGVGWYAHDIQFEPARYRRPTPIWSDQTFASIAGVIRADALLAAVRDATPGLPVNEECTAPYARDQWLFSHNGCVVDWGGPKGTGIVLRRELSDESLAAIQGATDSEVVFGLVIDAVRDGWAPPDAMASVVRHVLDMAPGSRLNLVMTDGEMIVATACGDTLFTRVDDGAVFVASEPFDDDPAWKLVPDRTLVVATRTDLYTGEIP